MLVDLIRGLETTRGLEIEPPHHPCVAWEISKCDDVCWLKLDMGIPGWHLTCRRTGKKPIGHERALKALSKLATAENCSQEDLVWLENQISVAESFTSVARVTQAESVFWSKDLQEIFQSILEVLEAGFNVPYLQAGGYKYFLCWDKDKGEYFYFTVDEDGCVSKKHPIKKELVNEFIVTMIKEKAIKTKTKEREEEVIKTWHDKAIENLCGYLEKKEGFV